MTTCGSQSLSKRLRGRVMAAMVARIPAHATRLALPHTTGVRRRSGILSAGGSKRQVQIQNKFEVPMAPAQAWSYLTNFASTVPCFPGAELTDQLDQDHYRGRVMVTLGSVL